MFGRKQKTELLPRQIRPEDMVNNRDQVIETYKSLELPRKDVILLGSAAIALYRNSEGLLLPRRAHDVDVIVRPELAAELAGSMTLANGMTLQESDGHTAESPHFTVASSPLPSELVTGISALDGSPFDRYQRTAIIIDDIPVIAPGEIERIKARPFRIGKDAKYKTDQDLYDAELLRALMFGNNFPRG